MDKSELQVGKFLLLTSDCGNSTQLRVEEDSKIVHGTEAQARKEADALIGDIMADGASPPTCVIVKVVSVGVPTGSVSWSK